MKSIFYYPALIMCFALLSFTGINYTANNSISLEESLKKGIIKIKVQGLGGYSGECLSATLQNISAQKVIVKINPGIVFNPDDHTMQDILIVKEQVIVLNNRSPRTINLFGFCCKSENRSPVEGMNFKISKSSNPKLIEVSNYLNNSKYDEDAMQSAVWSVSDGNSVSEIYCEKPEEVKPLRAEVCRLTGQTDN